MVARTQSTEFMVHDKGKQIGSVTASTYIEAQKEAEKKYGPGYGVIQNQSPAYARGRERATNAIQNGALFKSKRVYEDNNFGIFERDSEYGHDFVIIRRDGSVATTKKFSTLDEAKAALKSL